MLITKRNLSKHAKERKRQGLCCIDNRRRYDKIRMRADAHVSRYMTCLERRDRNDNQKTNITRVLEFEKDIDTGRWYVVLPNWTGPKEALEMVLGADTMLDVMSNGSHSVLLTVSTNPFEGADALDFEALTEPEGAMYRISVFEGKKIDLQVWLCEVTLFVLGKFPKKIYVKTVPFSKTKKTNTKRSKSALLAKQTLSRYESELLRKPGNTFWNELVKNTREYIKKLEKEVCATSATHG